MKTITIITLMLLSTNMLSAKEIFCSGVETGNTYDLEINKQSAVLSASNGGATYHFNARYIRKSASNYSLVFGLENYDSALTPVLSQIQIEEFDHNKARGKVSYFEHDYSSLSHELIEENIICSIVKEN